LKKTVFIFIEKEDIWYFKENYLEVSINGGKEEITYKYV
jgi:uncharacterized protein YneR